MTQDELKAEELKNKLEEYQRLVEQDNDRVYASLSDTIKKRFEFKEAKDLLQYNNLTVIINLDILEQLKSLNENIAALNTATDLKILLSKRSDKF